MLNALLGARTAHCHAPEEPAVEMGEGIELLEANTDALLGPASARQKSPHHGHHVLGRGHGL